MLEAILPASVSVAATRADIPDAALLPEEQVSVARAVEPRRSEFATARACARIALAPWGFARQPVPVRSSGAPRWPAGIVGSITHCDGYRGCAVAREEDLAAIGIDAEPNAPLPHGVLSDIAVSEEREWVRRLARAAPRTHWDRLLFSMKEAVYKAWFPLTGEPLDFEQAVVSVDPSSGSFMARLLVPAPSMAGRWLVRDGILLTAVVVPARAGSPHDGVAG